MTGKSNLLQLVLFMIIVSLFFNIQIQNESKNNNHQFLHPLNKKISRITSSSNQFISHDEIDITGNADFLSIAENEGWTGNGTKDFPIIISGYNFTGVRDENLIPNQQLICIMNVDIHFVIQNCYFTNYKIGILIFTSSNGLITNNTIHTTEMGIRLTYSSNITITNNDLFDNQASGSINIKGSENISISNNYIHDQMEGVYIYDSFNISIVNNSFDNNVKSIRSIISNNILINSNSIYTSDQSINKAGILIEGKIWTGKGYYETGNFSTVITSNKINYSSAGIEILYCEYDENLSGIGSSASDLASEDPIIIRNNIINNNRIGISTKNSSFISITNNTIFNNEEWGVYFDESTDINVQWNDFIGNHYYLYQENWINENEITAMEVESSLSQCNLTSSETDQNILFSENFWDDHRDDTKDINKDGIYDTAYNVSGVTIKDNSPTTEPRQHLMSNELSLHIISVPKVLYPLGYDSLKGIISVSWFPSHDFPDNHSIKYSIFYGLEDLLNGTYDPKKVTEWILLEDNLSSTRFEWDTDLMPDGWYHIKITAECEKSNIIVFDTNDRAFSIGINRQKNELRKDENNSIPGMSLIITLSVFIVITIHRRKK